MIPLEHFEMLQSMVESAAALTDDRGDYARNILASVRMLKDSYDNLTVREHMQPDAKEKVVKFYWHTLAAITSEFLNKPIAMVK